MYKDYKSLLQEKAQNEYKEFIKELSQLEPVKIIEKSYEKVLKEDILAIFEGMEFSKEEAKAMYLKKYPLDFVYREWLSNDYSHMELIEDTVKDSLALAIKDRKAMLKEGR